MSPVLPADMNCHRCCVFSKARDAPAGARTSARGAMFRKFYFSSRDSGAWPLETRIAEQLGRRLAVHVWLGSRLRYFAAAFRSFTFFRALNNFVREKADSAAAFQPLCGFYTVAFICVLNRIFTSSKCCQLFVDIVLRSILHFPLIPCRKGIRCFISKRMNKKSILLNKRLLPAHCFGSASVERWSAINRINS